MTVSDLTSSKWPNVRFDQMAECLTVRVEPSETTLDRYVGLEHLDPETLKISRWGTPADVIGEKLHFWPGDIIFGKRRAYQRKLAVADFEGICSAHAMVLRAKPEVVLPDFLPFFMQSDLFFERALSISVGSLSPTINWSTLAQQEFSLPPLDEQRRIAKILWATDEMIGKYELALTQARDLERVQIDNFLSNSLTFEELISSKSRNCEIKQFSQICRKITDGTHNPPKFSDCGIPFLLVSNISSGFIDWENVSKWIPEETYRELSKRVRPEEGDILYSVVGSYGVPIYLDSSINFSFQRHIAILKPDPLYIRGKYLYYYLRSSFAKKQAELMAVGNAQKTITLGALNKFLIPLPNIEDQERILQGLELVEKANGSLKSHIEKAKMVQKQLVESFSI